jgi:hypothetical protein
MEHHADKIPYNGRWEWNVYMTVFFPHMFLSPILPNALTRKPAYQARFWYPGGIFFTKWQKHLGEKLDRN